MSAQLVLTISTVLFRWRAAPRRVSGRSASSYGQYSTGILTRMQEGGCGGGGRRPGGVAVSAQPVLTISTVLVFLNLRRKEGAGEVAGGPEAAQRAAAAARAAAQAIHGLGPGGNVPQAGHQSADVP